jgi:SHS family lactate transporter-like MFS transporter
MISSPSAQIVNAIAESHLVTAVDGELAPGYGPTMGIATAIIAIGIAVTTAFGPERRGRKFELAMPAGVQEMEIRGKLDAESQVGVDKAEIGQTENVAEKR